MDSLRCMPLGHNENCWWPEAHGPSGAAPDPEPVAPATIKQNALRYWMNQAWDNDPDALMLRRRSTRFRALDLGLGLLNDAEALTATLNQYIGGGIVCFSDPVAEVDEDRLLLLRRVAPSLGRAAVPFDLFAGGRYPEAYLTVYRLADEARSPADAEFIPPGRPVPLPDGLGPWATVALVDWHDAPRRPAFRLTDAIARAVDPKARAWFVALQDGDACYGPLRPGDPLELPPVPGHGCAVYRLTPASEGRAAVLRTNGHFSMGGAEIRWLRETEAGVVLGLRWPWRCELCVELAVARPVEPADGPPAVTARSGSGGVTVAQILLRGPFEGEAALRYSDGS